MLQFANKHGWKLIDSINFNYVQIRKWMYNDEPIFPLTSKGFSDTVFNDAILINFPRRIEGDLTVFKFKTGWILFEPGTSISTEENGFILINNNENEMAVYHLWGE